MMPFISTPSRGHRVRHGGSANGTRWSSFGAPRAVCRGGESQPLTIVAAGLHGGAPVAVFDVPAYSRAQTVVEGAARRPAELASDLRRVDGVPAVVPGAIGYERLQGDVTRIL